MKTYSDEIVDRWIKEIDTLLVYVCRVSFAVNRSVEQPLNLFRRVCSRPFSPPSMYNRTNFSHLRRRLIR